MAQTSISSIECSPKTQTHLSNNTQHLCVARSMRFTIELLTTHPWFFPFTVLISRNGPNIQLFGSESFESSLNFLFLSHFTWNPSTNLIGSTINAWHTPNLKSVTISTAISQVHATMSYPYCHNCSSHPLLLLAAQSILHTGTRVTL